MSGNSLEHVLETMETINVTLGWGALAVYSRGCLNEVLEHHYLQRLGDWNSLPRFAANIRREDGSRTQLQAIEFGVPRLSFASATTQDRRVQVTLPILSGVYRHESPSADEKLQYFVIDESMGLAVDVDVSFDVVAGRGRQLLMLDLCKAVETRCNLGPGGMNDAHLAAELLRWFGNLKDFQSQFVLAEADSQGGDYWTPTEVRVYTQAAPGAEASEALTHGDGALLMFFKVKGRTRDGLAPSADFPFLVVDEMQGQHYPVTVVLDRGLSHLSGNLLDKLSFPPVPSAFVEQARYEPFDTALFGGLVAQEAVFTVDAPEHPVLAGSSHRFIVRDQHGQPVEATRWSVSGLEGQSGEYGDFDREGVYQAASLERLKREDPVIVVTARLYRDGMVYQASRRARVATDVFELQPEVAITAPTAPIDLHLSGAGTSLPWDVLDERHGRLERHNDTQATFVPDAIVGRKGLAVQQVRVCSEHGPRFSIVLANGSQLLSVRPEVFRKVDYRESLRLEEQDVNFMPEATRRWRLFGVGTLSEDGCFTAPSSGAPAFSVVTCEIEQHGVVLATGYNVLQVGRL